MRSTTRPPSPRRLTRHFRPSLSRHEPAHAHKRSVRETSLVCLRAFPRRDWQRGGERQQVQKCKGGKSKGVVL
ncbi:hypothetical protein TRSC58_07385 [Trypanosoma rangeli SC58]|uniref:Uncharacterized protein n=1 Tax=Trypanosoma rangeli SC58 TaxID=429131 RepID=A0A061ISX2_TRYRA|nr:hypothetical protein TRSC58_07385 [Trypanosoma rangeli SC58]